MDSYDRERPGQVGVTGFEPVTLSVSAYPSAAVTRRRTSASLAPPAAGRQPPGRPVLRIRWVAAIPPALSARRQATEPTSVLVRLTRTARAAETRPAATARRNPARATTNRERLPRCLWWPQVTGTPGHVGVLGGEGRSVAPRRCAGRATASRARLGIRQHGWARARPALAGATLSAAEGLCGSQGGGSPSGRNQSLLAGAGDSGWTDASGWPGGAVTASRS